MKKPVAVIIAENILPEYKKLVETVKNEKSNGVKNSYDQQLLKSLKHKIAHLKMNPQAGIAIPKDTIAKKYLDLYKVTNLWKFNLFDAWRLIYTLKNNEVEILAVILDFERHEDYDKTFGYRKRR